jgi:hypothetical protein
MTIRLIVGLAVLIVAGSHASVTETVLDGAWLFDEGSGSVTEDTSGNDRTGELMDVTWVSSGVFGGAVQILGGDSQVVINGYNGVGGTNPRTTVLWFKGDALIEHSWVKWGENATTNKYYIRAHLDGGDCWLRIETAGGQHYGSTNVCDGQWHHLAVVFPPGSTMVKDHLLYVDGVLEAVTGGNDVGTDTDASAQQVVIGGRLANHVNAEGLIDDVAIFSTALNESDIRKIRDIGLQGAVSVDPAGKAATRWATLKSRI